MSPHPHARPGFTLFETIAAIVVLAIALPPVLLLMKDGAAARQTSVQSERATWLANAVMEHIAADVTSNAAGLGFDALADSATYLNDPSTGLQARLQSIDTFYQSVGVSYTVSIGPLVDSTGTTTGDPNLDVFRIITVTSSWSGPGGSASFPISRYVSDLD